MSVRESGEMYLETILILSEKSSNVRSIDVGEYMGYSKPSVSRAVGLLKKEGMIIIDSAGHITLTEDGARKAKSIYERHTLLSRLLMDLGVDEKTAIEDACRIEHYISDTTFDAIKRHVREHSPDAEGAAETKDQHTAAPDYMK
ncbi:MAG: metal-dependent transcriptional regulator [Clostridia bacterium]|nr:metal-dependent transcriptional regulator [Clostridia bacterium]